MKKIFSLITVLITASLLGIIVIQISWLQNMMALKVDQVRDKIEIALNKVGTELNNYKSSYAGEAGFGTSLLFNDELSALTIKPVYVGTHFTVDSLQQKIRKAFNSVRLNNFNFEFAITKYNPETGLLDVLERHSGSFLKAYDDTVHNYHSKALLAAAPGTPGENLSFNEQLLLVVLDYKSVALRSLWLPILMALLFTIIIITAFYLTVRTMLRQKKLGEIKNDFINNMTHEFKTPIATISLAVDAIKNPKVLINPEKISYFSGIIKEENQRMNRQVETILKASQLEKQEITLTLKAAHVHPIMRDVLENFVLLVHEKQGELNLSLNAVNDYIDIDEVHFTNLVNNIAENALKYAKEDTPPIIHISTRSTSKSFILQIEDNGIGMSRETVKRIFERFYRAHTGNVHNVKGFGLGLSYVKSIVDAHNGSVRADSTLGRGSTFIIEFPLSKNTVLPA